jgi:hypothetical protein
MDIDGRGQGRGGEVAEDGEGEVVERGWVGGGGITRRSLGPSSLPCI